MRPLSQTVLKCRAVFFVAAIFLVAFMCSSPVIAGDTVFEACSLIHSDRGLQSGDSTDYPIFVEIHNRHRPGDLFDAYYGIYFFNFENFDLDSVVSITMIGPDGTPVYQYTRGGGDQNDFVKNQWNGFQVSAPGVQPVAGEYTFDVVTDDFSTTVTHVRKQNITIPLVDPASMSPAAGSVITSRIPVFEWGGIENPPIAVYYRLQIFDDTGYRLYASEREADLRSIALPEGLLVSDRSYFWIVSVYDTHDGGSVENASHTESSAFTLSDDLSNSSTSPPAIDLDGWGAVFWRHNATDVTSLRIKVTDHDGIAHDGSSHQASAICNGEIFPLTYFYSDSAYEAYYEYWENGTAPAGEYVFTVTDPDGHSATATDTLVVNPLPTADQAGFNLIPNGTSPTISWDPVPGADRYQFRIRDMNWNHVWNGFPRTTGSLSYTVPPGVLEPHTRYSYNIRARDHHYPIDVDNMSTCDNIFFTTSEISGNPLIELDMGSGAARNPLIDIISVGAATRTTGDPVTGNPETCLFFRVKVHDAQGVPDNIRSVTVEFPDGSSIDLELDDKESSTCGIYYAEDFNPSIAPGEYVITVEDLDGNIHSATDILAVNPILHPSDNAVNAVVNGTRVEVTWEQIAGATSYRLEIFDMEGNRLHRLGTTDNAYTIPAGYLKENTAYQYHVKAFRELFEQGVDNSSRSVVKVFRTGANQKSDVLLTSADPDVTISGGDSAFVYGTSFANHIILESGAQAELIHFPGQNLIDVQTGAGLFTVSRSGTVVTFQGADGTVLKIPATTDEQSIVFDGTDPMILRIDENQVKLNDQVIDTTTAPISIDSFAGCGAYVAPGVWKEFDYYNLAAIGKTTNDDPFTPSWRMIGSYWSSTESNSDAAWYLNVYENYETYSDTNHDSLRYGCSIRCVSE